METELTQLLENAVPEPTKGPDVAVAYGRGRRLRRWRMTIMSLAAILLVGTTSSVILSMPSGAIVAFGGGGDDQQATPSGPRAIESEALAVVSAFEVGQPLHCSGIDTLNPEAAQQAILDVGLQPEWRFEYSTGEDTGFAEYRDEPPPGRIIAADMRGSDIVVVTVAPAYDPLTETVQIPPQSCAG